MVLAHPDFEKPFILSTDTSTMDDGLGAVLSLVPAAEERTRPIAFAGKPLSQDCSLFLPVHVSTVSLW